MLNRPDIDFRDLSYDALLGKVQGKHEAYG